MTEESRDNKKRKLQEQLAAIEKEEKCEANRKKLADMKYPEEYNYFGALSEEACYRELAAAKLRASRITNIIEQLHRGGTSIDCKCYKTSTGVMCSYCESERPDHY